jgi:hypothetical protein
VRCGEHMKSLMGVFYCMFFCCLNMRSDACNLVWACGICRTISKTRLCMLCDFMTLDTDHSMFSDASPSEDFSGNYVIPRSIAKPGPSGDSA